MGCVVVPSLKPACCTPSALPLPACACTHVLERAMNSGHSSDTVTLSRAEGVRASV